MLLVTGLVFIKATLLDRVCCLPNWEFCSYFVIFYFNGQDQNFWSTQATVTAFH